MGFIKQFLYPVPDVAQMEIEADVKGLIKALRYKNDKQPRIEAAQALGLLADTQAIEPLILALDDLLVRDTAAAALCRFGAGAVPALIDALKNPSESIRLFAAQCLGRIGDTRAIEPLISCAEHETPQMRKAAIEALSAGRFKHDASFETLKNALNDVDAAVREAAVLALGESQDEQAVMPLTQVLQGVEQVLKSAATRALGNIGDKRGILPLVTAYEQGDVRPDMVIKSLGQIGDADALPTILEALGHGDGRVRDTALMALMQLKSSAVEPLIAALGNPEPLIRAKVAQALGHLGDKRAVLPLMALFNDPDLDVQTEAATSVGLINTSDSIDLLSSLLTDKRRDVRWCAAWALWHSKNPAALEGLLQALTDHEPSVREVALAGLRSMPDSRSLQPLIRCLYDEVLAVRQAAVKSLAALGELALDALIGVVENGDHDAPMLAVDALQLMSGKAYGKDAAAWREWATGLNSA